MIDASLLAAEFALREVLDPEDAADAVEHLHGLGFTIMAPTSLAEAALRQEGESSLIVSQPAVAYTAFGFSDAGRLLSADEDEVRRLVEAGVLVSLQVGYVTSDSVLREQLRRRSARAGA